MEEKLITLDYEVEQVVFKNEETGFAVLQGSVDGIMVTSVGELATVEEGEELSLTGYYKEHASFGTQFKVKVFERKLPTTTRAIKKFLASGAIKGIGPVLAERIVDQFGDSTLLIIEEDPQCLSQVKGISPQKVKKLTDEFDKLFAMRRLMIFLEGFGVSATNSVKAWTKWGPFALDMIQKNPYKLCDPEIGISFTVADFIAKKLDFSNESLSRISSGVEYVLRYNAKENGHTCVPQNSLVSVTSQLLMVEKEKIDEQIDLMVERGRLCEYDMGKRFLFLPSFYIAEQYIAQRISTLLETEMIDEEVLNTLVDIEEERMEIEFASLQRKAIKDAVSNGIFILTGGPGTGKTTILNAVISILEQKGLKIAICAPTGRAAKRLSELSGKNATTIHRLMGVQTKSEDKQEFVHHERNPLKHDVIVVDEMSMVDSMLFCNLLKAAKPGCRFILTGDINQLPSVSAGNVLKELISDRLIPSVELMDIFRQSAQSMIITNAHEIVNGELPNLSHVDNDFFFLSRSAPEQVAQTITDLCAVRLPKSYGYSPFDDIQVICPSRKGVIGTVSLNTSIQSRVNPKSDKKPEYSLGAYTFREGDKVMQVRNNYDIVWNFGDEKGTGIFNGDIGILRKINKKSGIMEVDFDGKKAIYALELAKELELAYAITIHKSQGNEFKSVIIPVMCGRSEFYNRNLLYTGITRAKEMLVLVGSSQSVLNMTNQVSVNYRYTGLRAFIKKQVLGE